MKIYLYLILALFFGFLNNISIAKSADILPEYSKVYDPQRDPFEDSKTVMALAQKHYKNVLIVVGGNWCSFCKKMDTYIDSTPTVRDHLYKKFIVLKVNMSEENKNVAFLNMLPEITSYPHVFVSTPDGKILYSNSTLGLQINGVHNEAKWLEFIRQWQPKLNEHHNN